MDLFASPKALLSKADKHITELRSAEQKYFSAPGTCKKTTETDPATGEQVLKVKMNGNVPLSIACIAFDAVNELRAALDHAVFSACSALGHVSKPQNIKFPFGDSFLDAKKQLQESKQIPEFLWDHLLNFEPYKTGSNILWGFNKIRNRKIHRMLVPYAAMNQSIAVIGTGSIGSLQSMNDWDGEALELTYARGRNINIQLDITFCSAFDPETELAKHRVAQTLERIAEVTTQVIAVLESQTADTKKSA